MPDIKYIPPSSIINPGDYYKPQSVFAAGEAGLEHGLAFGADLAAKIQETNRENDPEKLRADQLRRDLENARTEELIKDAKAKYERDQIYAAQERQAAIDATVANTEGQKIQNRYGPAREQSNIDYKYASIGNMRADNELGRVQAAIEARKMYGKESGNDSGYQVTEDPFGSNGSASNLPSVNQPVVPDPVAASLDAEIGNYFKNQNSVSTKEKYAQVSSANTNLQRQSEQLDSNKTKQSLANKYNGLMKEAVSDFNTDSALEALGAASELRKSGVTPEIEEDIRYNSNALIEGLGGVGEISKAIDQLPQEKQADARKVLNEAAIYAANPKHLSDDQNSILNSGLTPKHAANPDETYGEISNVISGGLTATKDPAIRALGMSPYVVAATEASRNGTQPFTITAKKLPVQANSSDVSGGQSEKMGLVFKGTDGTESYADLPNSKNPTEQAQLDLVTNVSNYQAKSLAASQGVKQDVQNLQSQAAANPNTASATTTLPTPEEKAEVGRPGIQIVNNRLEDDPNGPLMVNHNIGGVILTNKVEGPAQTEVKNRLKNDAFNSQVADLNEIPADKRGKAAADAKTKVGSEIESQYRTFERNVLAPANKEIATQKAAIDAGEKSLNQLKPIVNSPYIDTLLGNTYGAEFNRGLVKLKPTGPESAFLSNVDRAKAQNIEEFITKVKGSSAANSEGEQRVIAQLGITRETDPQNVRNLYDLYKASIEKNRNEVWLKERLLKEGPPLEGGTNIVTNYLNSPESEPIIFNESKYDSAGNVIPGHERDPDYIDNVGYKTAKEYLGFRDLEREREKARKLAPAQASQAPLGGGGNNGGFPVTSGYTPAPVTPDIAGAAPVASGGADIATPNNLTPQADLEAKAASKKPSGSIAPITYDNIKAATSNAISRISSWLHTTNVTESGREANLAANKLERSKQDPDFRAVVENMKQELNTPVSDSSLNPLDNTKVYDPGLIDFALDAVTPQFLESLGNKIIQTGVLPISERVSALFGGSTGEQFYQNYFARKQARQEIYDDARINNPYESFIGEVMGFAVLGDLVHQARIGTVKAIANKFPNFAAGLDYITGGALSGKTGKIVEGTKAAIAGGAEDTATMRLMDGGSDVANTLAFTTLLRGASPYIAKAATSIFGGVKSLIGRLSDADILHVVADKYVQKGGSEAHLRSEIDKMKQAVANGDFKTYNFKDTKLGEVLSDMAQEPGGAFAREMNRPGVIKEGERLSQLNESNLPTTRPTADIASDVRTSVQNKVADTIDVSRTSEEAALDTATKAHEREINKDLAAQRADINKQTRTNVKIREAKLKEIIDRASNTEKASQAIDDFVTEAGLDPVNLKGKATGGSPTGTLADARIQKMRELEESIQPEIETAYKYAERDLDGLDADAVHEFDKEFRKEFEFASPELIQANARRLESTTERVEQTREVPLSDSEMASVGPNDPLTKTVPTGRYELAPTFRSLDEFRQLIASSDLNQTVKNKMIDRARNFVQEQAESTGLPKGWYDRYLQAYGKAQEAKANIVEQRRMLEDIKASMQGGLEQGKGLYNKFAGSGKTNEKLESIFGKSEASNLRKAFKQHDAALKAIKKAQKAKVTPITQTKYSGDIAEAESNIKALNKAEEQMANRGADVPSDFPGISADLSRAAKKLGGVNQDIADALVNGETRFTQGLMDAMGADKSLLEESVTDWVARKAKDSAASFDSSGATATTKQLGISPDQWKNIQTIIGKSKSDVIEKYISQQVNIKRSVELIDRLPEGTKPGFFTALLKGPNPARRIMETPYFILDFLAKSAPYGSLNKKAFTIVKNLSNPNITEANKYAEDIANLIVDIQEKGGYQYSKVIEQKYGSIRQFANEAVYAAAALKYADENIDKPYLNRHQAIR